MSAHILVIDDDADILRVLRANLEFHGFRVATASSWAEGRESLASFPPDLVVLDLMLPDGDGLDICRSIRATNPNVRVVMLTAKDKISDKVMGLESGADDYVVKPFETLELIARIKARLRRAQPPEDESAAIGRLHIDFRKRLVSEGGKEISLTPKEYDLLRHLVTHRGEPVRREDLRKVLWKDDKIYSWSRVIDVHIQHLRQKIEPNPAEPEYILTVPGVGYRFRE